MVNFPSNINFRDAGDSPAEVRRTIEALSKIMESLGRRTLAPGATLRIDVLDIDLAGRIPPMRRTASEFRVMTGQADWPSLRLHWTLDSPGQPSRQGDETVSDINYLDRSGGLTDQPLGYEKRMLAQWFRARFGAPGR